MYSSGIAGLNTPIEQNQMYPGSQQVPSQYATPSQAPISSSALNASYEAKTDPYTGEMKLANGGIAALRYDEGGTAHMQPWTMNDGNEYDPTAYGFGQTHQAEGNVNAGGHWENVPGSETGEKRWVKGEIPQNMMDELMSRGAKLISSGTEAGYKGGGGDAQPTWTEGEPAQYMLPDGTRVNVAPDSGQITAVAPPSAYENIDPSTIRKGYRNMQYTSGSHPSFSLGGKELGMANPEYVIDPNTGKLAIDPKTGEPFTIQSVSPMQGLGGTGFGQSGWISDNAPYIMAALSAGAGLATLPTTLATSGGMGGAAAGIANAGTAAGLGVETGVTSLAGATGSAGAAAPVAFQGANPNTYINAIRNAERLASNPNDIGAGIGVGRSAYGIGSAMMAAKGGLMDGGGIGDLGGYSDGGRLLKGPGDGMSDHIPATIGDKQPARLAEGEFVIPADVVSHLGNGSTDAGAKHLYKMMDKIRRARTGNPKQGKQINANKFLPRN